MIKIFFLAIIFCLTQNVIGYKMSSYCPIVEPMKGFQWDQVRGYKPYWKSFNFYIISKFLGNWYLFIASKDLVSPGDNCFKNNHTLIGEDSLQMVQQWFE